MTLDQLFCEVRYQVRDFFSEMFPERPGSELQREHERLERKRKECSDRIARHRGIMDHLRQRLYEDERRVRQLSFRVEKALKMNDRSMAWRDALELDKLRLAMDDDRRQLRLHERSHRDHRTESDRIYQQLVALRDKMAADRPCLCT